MPSSGNYLLWLDCRRPHILSVDHSSSQGAVPPNSFVLASVPWMLCLDDDELCCKLPPDSSVAIRRMNYEPGFVVPIDRMMSDSPLSKLPVAVDISSIA